MDIIVIEKPDVPALFAPNGCDELIDKIRKEVAKFELSVDNSVDRKEVASVAYKVRQSKTVIDKAGFEHVKEMKLKVKAVDQERKRVRDVLDDLAKEVRKPLDEWEAVEEAKEEAIRQQLIIEGFHIEALAENNLFDREKEMELKQIEFERKAAEIEESLRKKREAVEREQAERDEIFRKLRETAERDQAAKEAEAQKRYEEAEAKAEAANMRAKQLEKEAEEREAAELAAWEKEKREKAEREQAIKDAERKAKEEKLLEKEKKAAEKDRKAREKKEAEAIRRESISDLKKFGLEKVAAENLFDLIKEGKINHISVVI